MLSPRSVLLLAIVACALLYAARLGTDRVTAAYPETTAQIEGVFPLDGHFHGEPLAHAERVRVWGSLAGADENVGAISVGPFSAPSRLRFGVTGYPALETNQLGVELVATGERISIRLPVDIGTRWNIVDFDLPPGWAGQSIRLVARDGSRAPGGWIGISEPLRGGRGEGNHGLRDALAAWAINGFLLGLVWLAALRWIARQAWVDAHWLPLVAAGVVATLGYIAFWIYFANAAAGKIFSSAVLLFALVQAWRCSPVSPVGREAVRVAWLLVGIGACYLTLLYLFPSSREFDNLAANRFRENLPGDNTLPHNFAATLYAGHSPKVPGAEWLSSDRPPLQAGWELLTWPATSLLRFDDRTASGTSAVWLQLLWIPAVYGLLRSVRMSSARACAWTAVTALNGFFLQNTVFTWPKLSAAAFACGAFALWVLPLGRPRRRSDFLLGAALAGLGWLSHGGVAFSYLALAPWLLWRTSRGEARAWLAAAGVFLLFAVPWRCYQKWYDPPGNMLLKLHFAGEGGVDARGTWQTIRDAYRPLAWSDIVERRRENFATQFGGDWPSLADFSTAGASDRRSSEFFHTARALGWWWACIPLLGVVLARPHRRLEFRRDLGTHAALLTWTAFTLVVWCLLMFVGTHAVIHQGSYATLLVLFAVFSAWLELASRWTIVVIAILQTATLATTYAVSNALVNGPPSGLPYVVLTGILLMAIVTIILRREKKLDCT